jgi:glycosyltransferase involved in cell wall biosynthesis
MAAGLPVITTPVGGIPSVFSEGVNGYFVNPGDTASLAARIVSMFENDRDCERISALTRQVAEERYAVETIGCQLTKVYEPLLQERAGFVGSLPLRNRRNRPDKFKPTS